MTTLTPAQQHILRGITSAVGELSRSLTEVQNRSARAIQQIEAGERVTGGIGSLLSHGPSRVDVAAGSLETLLKVASAQRIPDADVMAAYTSRDPW